MPAHLPNSDISHIFFDLHGTLIDGVRLHPCYSVVYGEIMAERFGGLAQDWAEVNRRIVADWDSYYADLDLGGDEGLAHMWEGLYRTTCAMFRLMDVPEPDHQTLTALSREIPGLVPCGCDGSYADAPPVIKALWAEGYILGVASHALVAQARATLQGSGLLDFFQGPIIGPDAAERFRKDAGFFRIAILRAGVDVTSCLLVDDHDGAIDAAASIGLHTVQILRKKNAPAAAGAEAVIRSLQELLLA